MLKIQIHGHIYLDSDTRDFFEESTQEERIEFNTELRKNLEIFLKKKFDINMTLFSLEKEKVINFPCARKK